MCPLYLWWTLSFRTCFVSVRMCVHVKPPLMNWIALKAFIAVATEQKRHAMTNLNRTAKRIIWKMELYPPWSRISRPQEESLCRSRKPSFTRSTLNMGRKRQADSEEITGDRPPSKKSEYIIISFTRSHYHISTLILPPPRSRQSGNENEQVEEKGIPSI